jgi:uracil-DNA glycosylase family 4
MKLVSERRVPHEGPEDAELFFIGEAPGNAEDALQRQMQGKHGELFDIALSTFGVEREHVRIGNLFNYQPAKNDLRKAHTTWQYEESRTYLAEYLKTCKHKVLIPMGNRAMDFLLGFDGVEKHRGSVYKYRNMLVIPTVHPFIVSREASYGPAFLKDIEKAIRIAKEGWTEPKFNFIVDPDVYQLEGLLQTLLAAPRLYVDIETKKHTSYIRCIGFAWSGHDAVCIFNDGSYESNPIGPNFRRVISTLLESNIPKTFHNGMFDTIMLEENGFTVNGWDYDTMVAQHVLQPELQIGLDYCTSMYTNINYYKDDGKESSDRIDRTKLGIYNCKDVVATAQVQAGQASEFDDTTRTYYEYKMKQIPLAKHFSKTGMLVDEVRRNSLKVAVGDKLDRDYMVFLGIQNMYNVEPFKVSQHAKINSFLYDKLGLPVKTTSEGKVTSGEDAVVALMSTVEKKIQDLKTEAGKQGWQVKLAALKLILRIRGYEKLLSSYINVDVSPDGRARSWYKFWGTETGRWSAGSWYDGTGLNGQTIPRESI